MDVANNEQLFFLSADWDTFDNVNRLIHTHNVDWKEETSLITTLHIACTFGYKVLVKHLIEAGSNINAKDKCRETPLSYAVGHSHYEVITLLLENNAKVSVQLSDGSSDLHEACIRDDLFLVRLLLEHGTFPNFQDKFHKETPLHITVINCSKITNSVTIVKLLVKFYADIRIKDIRGSSPIDYAKIDNSHHYDDSLISRARKPICSLKKTSFVYLVGKFVEITTKKKYSRTDDMKPKANCNKRPRIISGF